MLRLAIHCWNIASMPQHGARYNINEIVEGQLGLINKFKTPKFFTAEMEYKHKSNGVWYKECGLIGFSDKRLLTTTNPQGQLVLVGTYSIE